MGDLKALIEAVEAGETPEAWQITQALRGFYSGDAAVVPLFRMACDSDDIRAMGAALALFKELLPGWRMSLAQETEIIGPDATFLAFVAPMDSTRREHVFRPSGRHGNPARALLLATLKAVEAQK